MCLLRTNLQISKNLRIFLRRPFTIAGGCKSLWLKVTRMSALPTRMLIPSVSVSDLTILTDLRPVCVCVSAFVYFVFMVLCICVCVLCLCLSLTWQHLQQNRAGASSGGIQEVCKKSCDDNQLWLTTQSASGRIREQDYGTILSGSLSFKSD